MISSPGSVCERLVVWCFIVPLCTKHAACSKERPSGTGNVRSGVSSTCSAKAPRPGIAITRSPFNSDLAGTIPLINEVNARFKEHSGGRDLSDVPVRAFTGFLALVDAINRAGSTDPEKIRIALTETDIPPEKLIVPWRGIKFGSNGHNMLVRGILMQVQNGKYCTIYPFDLASCEVVYPMPTWEEKAAMK